MTEKQTIEQLQKTIESMNAVIVQLTEEMEAMRKDHAKEVADLQEMIHKLTLALEQSTHCFCNAHLQRELEGVFEAYHEPWARKLKKLLSEMCQKRNELMVVGETAYPPELLEKYLRRYDRYVQEGIRLNTPKADPKKNNGKPLTPKGTRWALLQRFKDYKEQILLFAYDWDVPFTNNEAERSIRFTKIKQKVSGSFRTVNGAKEFYDIMSFVGTARKHGVMCYDALLNAVNEQSLNLVTSWA